MSNEENAKRLGVEVRLRRLELHIPTAKALAEHVEVSPRLIGDIENGRRDSYSALTLLNLDKVLRWEPGSSIHTLEGGEPTPIEIATGLNRFADEEIIESDGITVTLGDNFTEVAFTVSYGKEKLSAVNREDLVSFAYKSRAHFLKELEDTLIRRRGLGKGRGWIIPDSVSDESMANIPGMSEEMFAKLLESIKKISPSVDENKQNFNEVAEHELAADSSRWEDEQLEGED